MNDPHSWLAAFNFSAQQMQAIGAAFVIAAVLPWLAEYVLPVEWKDTHFQLALYGIAIIFGPLFAVLICHEVAVIAFGFAAALGAQAVREVAARKWPILSPRQQTILKRDAQGNVVGYKEGDDKTQYFSAPAQPGSENETPK